MEEDSAKPKRRIRYKGTHPRNFKEKYKELNPSQYAGDIQKIISQGKTPAGMHRPICVNEILNFLNVVPGQTGMDATLGYGGHTLELLKLGARLFSTDVDPIEFPKTCERIRLQGYGSDVFFPIQKNFSQIDEIVSLSGPLDFVIADLGVSSVQIDNPDRGFTFKHDGPLDLRLNPDEGMPASILLQTLSPGDLEDLLIDNSDEEYAEPIAQAIRFARSKGQTPETTRQLKELIESALSFLPPSIKKEEIKKACQRTFQALRIAVNNEFEVLDTFLEKLPAALKPGGKIAILTFHSGEDRRVKKSFQKFFREGIYSEVSPTPIRASVEECAANPRAKSAKLRVGKMNSEV